MSIESVSRALNVIGPTPAERLVLIGIANHDGDGGAWPSIETLARYSCVKPRAVQTTISQMRSKGWIDVEVNGGGDRRTRPDRRPNAYVILWTAIERDAADDTPSRDATQRADGVQPIAPEPSLNHPSPLPPKRKQRSTPSAHVRELRNYDVPPPDADEIMRRQKIGPYAEEAS